MKPILVQPVGKIEYPQLNKPVHITPEFLASLTGKHTLDVHNEHNGPKITETTELFYMDGGLYALFKDKIDTKNKGFSALFDAQEMIEYDDHYEPIKAPILNIDQSSNPRNIETFLYNSGTIIKKDNNEDNHGKNKSDKEDDDMTQKEDNHDKTTDTSVKDEKIGALKYETNNHKDKINLLTKDLKSKEEELASVQSDKEKMEEENKKLVEKVEAYEKAKKEKAEQLARELAGKDETLLETYKKLDINDLENIKIANEKHDKYVADKLAKENPHKGVPGSVGADQEDSKGKQKEKEKDPEKWSREKYEEHKRSYGVY